MNFLTFVHTVDIIILSLVKPVIFDTYILDTCKRVHLLFIVLRINRSKRLYPIIIYCFQIIRSSQDLRENFEGYR